MMPFSKFKTLDSTKLRPCLVVLQIEDKTRAVPNRIIENVLIKVGKFIISSGFIVLEYNADEKVQSYWAAPFRLLGRIDRY